nr:PREDICTED: MKRN2 opposite strand protein [Opisthocomus hoazin]
MTRACASSAPNSSEIARVRQQHPLRHRDGPAASGMVPVSSAAVVTDPLRAAGVVYNYDEEGVHRAETGWEQCISIPLVQPDMFGLLQQWDKLLEEFSAGEDWLPHRYDEHDHNCYTYALAFVNSVLTAQGKQQMSKSEFTERFVIPRTKQASRYLTLHQELTAKDFYIVPLPDGENQG